MQSTLSEGVRIAYAVEGDGQPLLLVHGLGYDSAGWGPLLPLLRERFTVVRFDNRGTGESEASRLPFTVRSLARDAAAVLAAAEVGRAHVLGISLGGLVAQELAASSPQLVGRLVLAGTTPGGPRSFGPPKPLLRLFAQAPTIPRDELLHRLVVNALGPGAPPDLVGEIFDYRRAAAPRLSPWLAQAAAGAWFGITGRSSAIGAPTLVVHGSADNVVDPRNGRLLADGIPGARFVAFEDAGHLLYWEQPQRFASVVGGFLAE